MATGEKRGRGFAGIDPQKQREIASKGGRAAHEKGTAHEFTPEEAREAGRKGGEAVSRDREHMAKIGREGGRVSGSHRAAKREMEDSDEQRVKRATPSDASHAGLHSRPMDKH